MVLSKLKNVAIGIFLLTVIVFAGSDAQAQIVDVDIAGFAFSPTPLNIATGTTVRWTNQDGATHTSTSDSFIWDSGNLSTGQQFSYTFNVAGTYPYHCEIHPSMLATVIVTDPGPSVPSMSTYGFIILSILLVGTSVWFIYRRQRVASNI